jgi:transcriptional regulator with XRE-family HTH domain
MDLIKVKGLIANKRKLRGLNQTEVSKVLNISQPAYSKYETGDSPIPLRSLELLNQMLDLGLDLSLECDVEDKNTKNIERIASALEEIVLLLKQK